MTITLSPVPRPSSDPVNFWIKIKERLGIINTAYKSSVLASVSGNYLLHTNAPGTEIYRVVRAVIEDFYGIEDAFEYITERTFRVSVLLDGTAVCEYIHQPQPLPDPLSAAAKEAESRMEFKKDAETNADAADDDAAQKTPAEDTPTDPA